MPNIREQLGNNISRYREMANLTKKELASKVHVSAMAVSHWEAGDNAPDIETLIEICNVLDVPIESLYEGCWPEKQAPELQGLNSDEKTLINDYRALDTPVAEHVRWIIHYLAAVAVCEIPSEDSPNLAYRVVQSALEQLDLKR